VKRPTVSNVGVRWSCHKFLPSLWTKIIQPKFLVPRPTEKLVSPTSRVVIAMIIAVVLIAALAGVLISGQVGKKLSPTTDEIERKLARVPEGYYSTNFFPNYNGTFSDLKEFLYRDFKLPRGYQEGVFDCSESAAYLEWALEDAGFDAYIATGPAPWDPSAGYHAWILVKTREYRVAIEPTALTGYSFWGKIEHFFTVRSKESFTQEIHIPPILPWVYQPVLGHLRCNQENW